MCLAIPGKVIEIRGKVDDVFRTGKVSFYGVIREVNMSLVPEVELGNYVLVHVGVALNIVDEEEAQKTFELLREIGELDELENDEAGLAPPHN
jgi:hydrogenase expression/formation protein HypC